MKVSNGRCIRHLAWKSLQASRTRNLIAIAAIALTAVLFTSLFTIALSINEGFQQSNFRQVGGFSHGGFKYLTEEQAEDLRDDPLIEAWAIPAGTSSARASASSTSVNIWISTAAASTMPSRITRTRSPSPRLSSATSGAITGSMSSI